MKTRVFALALIAILISGCEAGRYIQTASNNCGGMGYSVAIVTYGDSVIDVPAVINLRPGSEFRVKLVTRRPDFPPTPTRDLQVTVEGNTVKDPDSAWITSRTTTYNTSQPGGFMPYLCVPMNQPADDYYYLVTVENVGTLDPRARVN